VGVQELLWVKCSCIHSDFIVLVLDGCLNRCVADG